jgi:hypothetical protein
MDAKETIVAAWTAVQGSGVPPELQETAFKLAVELLRSDSKAPAGGPSDTKPKPPAGSRSSIQAPVSTDSDPVSTDPGAVWTKFADEAEIDRETLEQVFYIEDNKVHLNVKAHKIADSKPNQMRAIGLALTVAYDYAFDVSPVSFPVVRAECERLKCLDSKNFGTYMGAASGLTVSGPSSSRVLKSKSDARKLFSDWVSKMAGGSETTN